LMTLKYIWRSFSLGCHFHVHFSYPWHAFASHGLPAIAELLVVPGDDKKKRKGKVYKVTSGLYFTHLWSRFLWTDFHKNWHGCKDWWRNHSFQFWSQYVQQFQIYRGQNFRFPIDFAGHRYNSAAATAQPVGARINVLVGTGQGGASP